MKSNILFLLVAVLAIAGCRSGGNSMNTVGFEDNAECGDVRVVEYSMPNGNDLQLETANHVIKIEAQPGKLYDYYVWTGEKTYADDPDLIIQEGTAAVLVAE